jgi:hypothetical protein
MADREKLSAIYFLGTNNKKKDKIATGVSVVFLGIWQPS